MTSFRHTILPTYRLFFLFPLLVFMLFMTSCEKNCRYSALDGFWRVDEVTDFTTGITTEGNARLFMSFEYQFVKLSWLPADRTPGFLGYEYIASCSEDNGTLSFGTFYKYREESTPAPADKLTSFGIPYDTPTTFTLTYTNSGRQLTLTNSTTQITLTKY